VNENPGCLGAILRLLGLGPKVAPALPFRMRDDFLSPAEMSFYRALCLAAGERASVCPKVNLADVFFVVRPNENQGYRNRIDRKHVDFLLCDSKSMTPLLGVELDDKSHQREDRQARDEFVDEVFRVAGLPLLHVPAQADYDVGELAGKVAPYLAAPSPIASVSPVVPTPEANGAAPTCPKCGVPMVVRTASRGDRQGEKFYGCPNYPKCRQTQPFTGE
jgi:predicted RNA-binding Zn-ribbon protein involved in translation (DUF1610 family)